MAKQLFVFIIFALLAVAVGIAAPVPARANPSITEYPIPTANSWPEDIAPGPDGNLWFVETQAGKIGRITTSGAISEYAIPSANSGPYSIAAGSDGALWFTEGGQGVNKIGRVTTAGAITEYALAAGSTPWGIAAGADGALWFTEAGSSKTGRITTGGTISEYPIPTANGGQFIAGGPDGALWFTEPYGNIIGRVSIAGAITEYPLAAGSAPWDIAAGADGALWFTEAGSNKIGRVTTAGVVGEYSIPTASSGPEGIAAGPDGALWFTEVGSGKIGRITTAGVISEYPLPATGAGPEGIAAGPDGALWFAEYANNKIGRITTAPDFKLPYAQGTDIVWVGGPHVLDNTPPTGSFPAGEGSGIDFACASACAPNGGFQVLAIAAGTVEKVQTDCTIAALGCFVAVRHRSDNSVAVYAHLDPPQIAVAEGNNVWQGRPIGIAGSSGVGAQGHVHLHLELRKGNVTGSTCSNQSNCFGNPLDWDGVDIDTWRIYEYYTDGEGTDAYNYDGSAVKGSAQMIPNFAYVDIGPPDVSRCQLASCQQPPVVARVSTAFDQSPNRCDYATAQDCEDNGVDLSTQFAKSGDPGSLSGEGSAAGSTWPPLSAGHLISTNVALPTSVGGITSLTDPVRKEDRQPPGRAGELPFGALAVVGVSGAAGAIWFARRRVGR